MLDGYKTYIGGASFIINGISILGIAWFKGDEIPVVIAWGLISTGISIIGGRSAFKKNNKN